MVRDFVVQQKNPRPKLIPPGLGLTDAQAELILCSLDFQAVVCFSSIFDT